LRLFKGAGQIPMDAVVLTRATFHCGMYFGSLGIQPCIVLNCSGPTGPPFLRGSHHLVSYWLVFIVFDSPIGF